MNDGSRSFIDTNVLVYAFDRSDPRRQALAAELLVGLLDQRAAVLSVQVLREFYVVATRKIAAPISHDQACDIIRSLTVLHVVDDTLALFEEGLEVCQGHQLSLWDALIVVAARAGGCAVLYTEDLTHDQVINGVRVVNPFVREC